jgi:hypothetical protein
MAIFQPAFVLQRVGADFTVTATVTGDVSAFALRAQFRDQVGSDGTTWATKTTGGGGIVATYSAPSTSVVVTLNAADMANVIDAPGAYIWRLECTDSGVGFDLIDWSTIWLTPDDDSDAPQLVNMSQVVALARGALTETVSDTDAKYYTMLIAAAESVFRRLCGRNFSYGTYTEYLDAPVRGNLFTREAPIHQIDSIRYDGTGGFGQLANTFDASTALDSTTDYYFRKDRPDGLGWAGEIFTTRPHGWAWWGAGGRRVQPAGMLGLTRRPVYGAFKVVYRAGFKIVPADIIFAVTQLVTTMSQRTSRGTPFQSESGMSYSYSLASAEDAAARLDSVQAVVAGYKRGDSYVA